MPLPLTTTWAIAISMVRTCHPKELGNCPSFALKCWHIYFMVRCAVGGLKLRGQTTGSCLTKARPLSESLLQAGLFRITQDAILPQIQDFRAKIFKFENSGVKDSVLRQIQDIKGLSFLHLAM